MVPERAVVEEDAGNDERPGEGAPAGLVGTGHEPRAEPTVEAQELLAGPSLHDR
jgi:hypothetical protein